MTEREALAVLFGISYEEAELYGSDDLTDEDYDELERIKSYKAGYKTMGGATYVYIDYTAEDA